MIRAPGAGSPDSLTMNAGPALPALHILYEEALPRYDSIETFCRALSTSAQRGLF